MLIFYKVWFKPKFIVKKAKMTTVVLIRNVFQLFNMFKYTMSMNYRSVVFSIKF
jgi:hypothetical protein